MRIFKRQGKRGITWVLDYYVRIGSVLRRRQETFHLKKLAEQAMAKRRIEIAENRFLDKRNVVEDLGFKDAVDRYMDYAKANKKTWKRDRQSLDHWLEHLKGKSLQEICNLDVERYKVRRMGEVKPRTVFEEMECLSRLFNRMIDWGLAERNPVKGVRRPKQPPPRKKMLTPEEEQRLIDSCCPTLRPVVVTVLHSGMRKGEILALTWDDIDFHRGVVIVRDSKNGESREVPMSQTLRGTLEGLQGSPDSVFYSARGKPLRDFRTAYLNAVKKAGFKDLTFHDLRHVFTGKLVERGVDLFTIMQILGHKSLTMTRRYAHVSPKHRQEVIRLLDDPVAGNDVDGTVSREILERSDGPGRSDDEGLTENLIDISKVS